MEPVVTKEKKATLSLEEMVDLRAKGLSLVKIGKLAGISKQAVAKRLQTSGLDPADIGQFTKDRTLILRGKQKLVLSAITPEKVKTMSVRDAAVAAGILMDKERLLEGPGGIVPGRWMDVVAAAIYLEPYRGRECDKCHARATGIPKEGGLCPVCRGEAPEVDVTPLPAQFKGIYTTVSQATEEVE